MSRDCMLDMVGDPKLLIKAHSRTGRVRVVLPAALTVDALDETYCFIFFFYILQVFVPGARAVLQT